MCWEVMKAQGCYGLRVGKTGLLELMKEAGKRVGELGSIPAPL